MESMEFIRKQLKQYRLSKNMTQSRVADLLGVKDNTITNYEKGTSKPSLDTIIKLCNIYDVNPNDLISAAFGTKTDSEDVCLSHRELTLIDKYKSLSDLYKDKVDDYVDMVYTINSHDSKEDN